MPIKPGDKFIHGKTGIIAECVRMIYPWAQMKVTVKPGIEYYRGYHFRKGEVELERKGFTRASDAEVEDYA